VLAVDVGDSDVKLLATDVDEAREFRSGRRLSAAAMVERVLAQTEDWRFDVVSVGVAAQVPGGRVVHDPVNLGGGWAGFDYGAAFGRPTKVVNDAAMQALGSYRGGRMLFLGLGTGLGSAFVADGVVEPMELGHLPYRRATYERYVSRDALERVGRKRRDAVVDVVEQLSGALAPDKVVGGGGAADEPTPDDLPAGVRIGDNANAFAGGFRLWEPSGWRKPASAGGRR